MIARHRLRTATIFLYVSLFVKSHRDRRISLSVSCLKYAVNNILTFWTDCRVSAMLDRDALIKGLRGQIGIDN